MKKLYIYILLLFFISCSQIKQPYNPNVYKYDNNYVKIAENYTGVYSFISIEDVNMYIFYIDSAVSGVLAISKVLNISPFSDITTENTYIFELEEKSYCVYKDTTMLYSFNRDKFSDTNFILNWNNEQIDTLYNVDLNLTHYKNTIRLTIINNNVFGRRSIMSANGVIDNNNKIIFNKKRN